MVTFAQARPGIFAGESGGDYNALYNYQNREGGRFAGTRLTDMSVGDVMQFTDPRGEYAQYVRGQVGRTATPVGAYQVVGTTLRGAVDALGIDPSTPFNQATQDRIGEWILAHKELALGKAIAARKQEVKEWMVSFNSNRKTHMRGFRAANA